jgi:hypothetical protein
MRIEVGMCNVRTNEHSTAYSRQVGERTITSPDITVPGYRLRLSIAEAERLSHDLAQAVEEAKRHIELV